MFKEQMKNEAEMNSNKSHISNSKNLNNTKGKNIGAKNAGINFDNLNDWDNIVYPNNS